MDRTLQAMSVFAHIARVGSFTAAAELLGISAGSASTLVRQLEGHLGVMLLHRSTRCIRLTAEGTQYFEHCERILGEIDEMKDRLGGGGKIAKGRLAVDVDQEVAHTLLPLVPGFRAEFPDVDLRVDVGGEQDGLIANGVDCAVVVGQLADSSLRSRRVGDFHAVTVASPAYLARRGTPHGLDELHAHDVIHYTPRRFGPPREFCFGVGADEVRVKLAERICVNDARAALRYAAEGVGIAQVCRRMAAEELAAGRLVGVLEEYGPAPLPISVLYTDRRHVPMSIRAFIDWIQLQLDRGQAEPVAALSRHAIEARETSASWIANARVAAGRLGQGGARRPAPIFAGA
ncbi:LysR family transcriptional regulator [Burkholderia gladioli]|uniref:LysR family transcriptional regulator n=1 Tax=Burkholderia gladioli TaxID=28095 RepID=UPI000D000EC3|nr:LysR family transcriptional regulator [Burkholderia gladioli]MBU9272354.1 LysR family transcriptional regulator [Burkholderia gladioli]MDD1785505.1 LysR family transcriptional regulator [Burkholderia gladioli]MDN7716794.1 LysR family transcriptional regulator [Burkholderia gladioli]PRE12969.1 LysR family transcriptional regulator [Burkholderia gladioli]PRG45735.1 LysR family transcriptional regulator [Burkholderia gladioli]